MGCSLVLMFIAHTLVLTLNLVLVKVHGGGISFCSILAKYNGMATSWHEKVHPSAVTNTRVPYLPYLTKFNLVTCLE